MTELLDQAEIDALLSAVDSGEVEEPGESTLIFSRHRSDFTNVEVRRYDFKRPERVSKDQMRSLQTLHEAFARNLGAAMSGYLRTIVEVKVASCEQMTYQEFIAGLPNPTSFNLLKAAPLEGSICLEISPLIIYPIIDRLLGGTNQELFIPQRPLTAIEERLIHKILERAMTVLREAWQGIRKLDFAPIASESNPQLVQLVPPNEVVIVIGFEVKMSARAGTMNLCIPYNVIEPVVSEFGRRSWFSTPGSEGHERFAATLGGRLTRAGVLATGLLAETTITVADLTSLSVGDLIVTEKPANKNVVLCVEGRKKFLANIGQHKGQRALKIVRQVGPKDRV